MEWILRDRHHQKTKALTPLTSDLGKQDFHICYIIHCSINGLLPRLLLSPWINLRLNKQCNQSDLDTKVFFSHSFSNLPPHYSCPEWEWRKSEAREAVNTSKAKERQNEFQKSYFQSTLIVLHGAGKLLLSLQWPSLLPWNFKPVAISTSLNWGLYYLKVRKVSSAGVCLGEKSEWFKQCPCVLEMEENLQLTHQRGKM